MFKNLSNRPGLFSLIFHGMLLLMAFGVWGVSTPKALTIVGANTPIIKAKMLTEANITLPKPAPKPKPKQVAKTKPKATPKKTVAKKSAPQKKAKKKVALNQKKSSKKAAKKPEVKQEVAKKEAPKQPSIAEKLRQMAQSSLSDAQMIETVAQQRAAAANARLTSEKMRYMGLIRQRVESHWINQQADQLDLSVTLKIDVSEQGQVQRVNIVDSSGDAIFDRHAVLAVEQSSPLPMPKDDLLRSQFRVIILPFSNS